MHFNPTNLLMVSKFSICKYVLLMHFNERCLENILLKNLNASSPRYKKEMNGIR